MLFRYFVCSLVAVSALHAQAGRGGRIGGPGQASGPPLPPPPSDCAASGTVVNALTGEPIPRAMVVMNGGDGAGSSTDAQGRWNIVNTGCGSRMPTATRPGFIPMNQLSPLAGPRQNMIQLVSGTPVNNVKISLMPGGTIAGTVRDSDGDPVDQAQIRILRVGVQQGKRVMNQQGGASVDTEGNFRINSLTPGHYVVCADSQRITYPVGGGDAMIYRESCFPGPVSTGLSNSMQVDAGREVRTSFTLTAARGVHLRGMVSGMPAPPSATPSDGIPQGGGRGGNVQLIKVPNGGGGRGGGMMRDGTFEITNVQPGSYILRAMLPGGQPGPAPSAQTQIEVGDSDIDNIVLAYETPGAVNGTLRFELSQTGASTGVNPVVNVNLAPANPGEPFFGPIPQAQWDTGHTAFVFSPVSSGQFRLNANVNGAGFAYVKSATLRGQDVLNQGFNVNGTVGPVDVVVSDDMGSVDVTVNDDNGQPIAASILLLSKSGQRRILSSGDDGHATAKNLPTGEYKAWAFDNVNNVPYAEEQWMSQNAGPGENVSVTTAGTTNITLKKKVVPAE